MVSKTAWYVRTAAAISGTRAIATQDAEDASLPANPYSTTVGHRIVGRIVPVLPVLGFISAKNHLNTIKQRVIPHLLGEEEEMDEA